MSVVQANASRRRDRGEATVELVALVPLVVLLLLIGVQVAVHAHAAHVATAAAAHGAAVAATSDGTAFAGGAAARRMVGELGANVALPPVVATTQTSVSVEVAVVVARLVPFFPRAVARRVTEPKERMTWEWER